MEHLPVLFEETLRYLITRPDGIYVDCTVGGGGHLKGILENTDEKSKIIGIDQDGRVLEETGKKIDAPAGRVKLIKGNFRYLEEILNSLQVGQVTGVLLDLGVSSFHLDEAERGFSYRAEAKLDMRMDPEQALTAWHIVNEWPREDLIRIIKEYGEERYARRIAEGIIRARDKGPIDTTLQLVDIIKNSIPAGEYPDNTHPARRTFQALRIAVNDELGALQEVLPQALKLLEKGGRLCIITFHSLEDRIVKEFMTTEARDCLCPPHQPVCNCGHQAALKILTRKPVTPGQAEVESNYRARSAKLRAAQKI